MASPHAVGVAALIVAAVRQPRPAQRRPDALARPRRADPARHRGRDAVPDAGDARPTHNPQYTATCEGTPQHNGFYGDGIVSAARIVGAR